MIKSYLHKTVIIIGLLMVSISQTGMVFIAPKAAMISNSSNTLKLSDNLGVNQGLSNNVSFIEKANLKHVYVNFSDGFSEAELMSYANPENFSYEFKTADIWLSTKDIARLTLNPKVLSIIEVSPAQFMSGGFLTEGYSDASHGIQSYLQNGNSAGEGIKIGVISNGVNNIQTAIASGDIPADVVIMKDRYIGDEGTAMLEILHDIAPAAKLYFSDSGNSTIGLNNSIKRLVDAGCNIIVDDAVYISEPFFEDGIVAKYIESYATPKGVLYISSAGNFADSHYQGTFTSTYNKPNYEQDFSQGVGSIQHLPFTVLANSKVMVVLQWNDPYKDSKNDLFLKVCDSSLMTTCFTSDNAQLGVGYSPYELVTLSNTTNASLTYYVGVYSFTPKTNVQIELYTFNGRVLNYGVEADSIFGHATSKDVLAIAATNQNAISVKRPYSSIGPFTMLDGTTRNKPDFTGVDNVTVSGTGGFTSPLNGTSAAAPHIAGIAALLWSNAMTLSRTDLIALIKSNTLDLMQEGFDVNTGYG
ncbi:MAG: S8 family serine peptidase, partial [Erysipelotrichaceae bacterium]